LKTPAGGQNPLVLRQSTLIRDLTRPPFERNGRQLAVLITFAALLYLAAGTGMAYVTGWNAVYERLVHANWLWLVPAAGAVVIGYCGYYVAYRGLYIAKNGPRIDARSLIWIVAAGFGGLLAHGAGAFDELALRAGGFDKRQARVRVAALAGFEHGALAAIVCPAAIIALLLGYTIPRADFTLPWAIVPLPGFILAGLLAARFRERLRDERGILGAIGVFLDCVHITLDLFRHPIRKRLAVVGMALYWGAEMFALWTTTAAFGTKMGVLAVIIVLGTGMIVTRRTGPFGGAGILLVALVPTLGYGAAVPFAAATLGVAAYQFFTLWLPLPVALVALPKLRRALRVQTTGAPDARAAGTPRPVGAARRSGSPSRAQRTR
jgi:hypothetical protein